MAYEVLGLLGRGGMAMVELAVDGDGRQVARKHVPLTGSVDEMAVARMRLRREAQVLAALQHPAIVPLLAVEDDGADVVIVMPALAGSLSDRVSASGPLGVSGTWRMGRPLIDALAWAHRRGIVHRDIKPANVLFDDAGRPALADFGIAWSRDLTGGLTRTGTILGTPAFLSPEQARGERAGPASDVFSLGATLLYALTGTGPYRGTDPAALALQAAHGDVVPVPSWVPESLARPLSAMIDPRPQRRPHAAELLGAATDGHLLPPPPVRIVTGKPPASTSRHQSAGHPAADGAPGRLVVGRAPETARRQRRKGVAVSIVVALALIAGAVVAGVLATAHTGPSAARPTSTCTALTYQPCGQPPASHTNGVTCLPGWYDLDGSTADGCEAVRSVSGQTGADYTLGRDGGW